MADDLNMSEQNQTKGKNMKAESLIIDLRKQLPWHRRYFSTTKTAMLWAFWLLLWRPIVILVGYLSLEKPQLIHYFFEAFAKALENGLIALIACAVSLWLWSNFVPAKTKKEMEPKSTQDYADHFNLNVEALVHSRQQKISTVHHDADGRITYID